MITVPATVGVMMRRRIERRPARRNWKSDEAITSVVSRAGPPCTSAATETAMKAPEVPMMRTYPDPRRPSRMTWTMLVRPLTMSAPNAP